jgi:N-acetylglutamate synthase-like GNAT family acetyltransferase
LRGACGRSNSTLVDWIVGEYVISTDATRLDIDLIQRFLANESYWARGIPRRVLEKAVRHSLCFGIYADHAQVGFARVVTDYATYGYIMDVFVLPEHRGRGLSKRLMQCIMTHPDLQGFRRWQLGTLDAHGLYAQFGFTAPAHPERFMERTDAEVYLRGAR